MIRPFRRRPAAPAEVPDVLAAVVDEIAQAYVAHPGQVAVLLLGHAFAALAVEAAVIDPHTEEWQLAVLAAEADGTRRALLDLAPAAQTITRTAEESPR